MCDYTMGGSAPISWTEINSYSIASQYYYDAWEKEVIRKMSENYCQWLSKGKDNNIQSPYNPFAESEEALTTQRNIVNNQWAAIKAARKAAKQEANKVNQKAKHLTGKDTPML